MSLHANMAAKGKLLQSNATAGFIQPLYYKFGHTFILVTLLERSHFYVTTLWVWW